MTSTNTTSDMTAKDFQGPLMSALYALSNGQPKTAIWFKDAYQPVMDLMGIATLDAHGKTSGGKEQVAQWIQWAYKNLKRTGQVEDTGRGKWALSAKGVAEAKTMTTTAQAVTTSTPATAPGQVSSPVTPATAPGQVSATAPGQVSSPVTPGNGNGTYHADAYIRTLGAAATACFGNYSHKSDTCQRCPIQGPCINFLAAELSRLTSVLNREDEAEVQRLAAIEARKQADADRAKAAAARPAAAPARPTAAAPAPAPVGNFDWSAWAVDAARDLIAKAESTCPNCNKPVKKGQKAMWLRAVKVVGGRKKAVLFHKECGPPGK